MQVIVSSNRLRGQLPVTTGTAPNRTRPAGRWGSTKCRPSSKRRWRVGRQAPRSHCRRRRERRARRLRARQPQPAAIRIGHRRPLVGCVGAGSWSISVTVVLVFRTSRYSAGSRTGAGSSTSAGSASSNRRISSSSVIIGYFPRPRRQRRTVATRAGGTPPRSTLSRSVESLRRRVRGDLEAQRRCRPRRDAPRWQGTAPRHRVPPKRVDGVRSQAGVYPHRATPRRPSFAGRPMAERNRVSRRRRRAVLRHW